MIHKQPNLNIIFHRYVEFTQIKLAAYRGRWFAGVYADLYPY